MLVLPPGKLKLPATCMTRRVTGNVFHRLLGVGFVVPTGQQPGGMEPERNKPCWAKIWRRGMGSDGRQSDSTEMLTQKTDQSAHMMPVEWTRLHERRVRVAY